MDEKKLLDQIRQSASGLTPPESLNPDAIEKLLTQKKPAKKKLSVLCRLAAAAAVFALCAVSFRQVQKIQKYSARLEHQMTERTASRKADPAVPAETEEKAVPDKTPAAAGSENTAAIPAAESYEEVYAALRENFYYADDIVYDMDTGMEAAAATSGAGTAEIAMEDGAAVPAIEEDAAEQKMENIQTFSAQAVSADYSSTNIQELGVDEADIVKTDGQYIYILRQNGSVTIVDAQNPQAPKEISSIPPAGSDLLETEELYVGGDILNVIATRQTTSLSQDGDVYYPSSARQTVLYTYDISDRANPKHTGTVTQDGFYETSRKNGSFLYLFTSYYPEVGATYAKSRIVPAVNGADLNASDFYLPESLNSSSYLLISSVNTEDPQNILDKKALVSGTSNFYVSPENIYIANENWNQDPAVTEIMKFHYKDGMIAGTAAGSVKGYLNNSFSMNEYNGFLRVVSTYYGSDYKEQNGLYILDEDLHAAGSIEDLAGGETIRSARFFGDTAYFVTFRQTDPLFSADLSDPAAPVILGELKVSGFSSYLHFYGQDLLLGMGYEADETTGATSGVKLSMFDISDPANVKELHRLVIPGVTWCPSIENYRSILIDPQKNVFGFFCGDRYLVFSYDREQGFVSELVFDFVQDALLEQAQTSEAISADNTRGLYIGDTLYLAGDVSVISFDMTDGYRRLGKLSLNES